MHGLICQPTGSEVETFTSTTARLPLDHVTLPLHRNLECFKYPPWTPRP